MRIEDVRYIIIERAEGLTRECAKPEVFGSVSFSRASDRTLFDEVDERLSIWNRTAPKNGYHKADIIFIDRNMIGFKVQIYLQEGNRFQVRSWLQQ